MLSKRIGLERRLGGQFVQATDQAHLALAFRTSRIEVVSRTALLHGRQGAGRVPVQCSL
jgi:hypothetical protein